MADNVTATLVVNFARKGEAMLIAEIDDRESGFNGGITQFSPGDSPAYLLFKTDDVVIDTQEFSAPGVSAVSLGTGLFVVEEDLQFVKEREASLSKPFRSGLTYKWLGNNLGAPQVIDQTKVRVPSVGLGVLRVSYRAEYRAYRLSGVPAQLNGENSFPIIIYVVGHTV